jgi:hypothetical protein
MVVAASTISSGNAHLWSHSSSSVAHLIVVLMGYVYY